MMTTFNQYQEAARLTAIYPGQGGFRLIGGELEPIGVMYCALGLAGEAGEVAEKVKKLVRDGGDKLEAARVIRKELGDVIWYVANLAHELGLSMDGVANENLKKLADRKDRGVLQGSGDER